jgi:GWxTD domain-containing protein
MIFLLFLQIQWQTTNRLYSANEQELIIYFSIPSENLKYIAEDSLFYAEYENQITVYDEKGNQLTGDYWEITKLKDTFDINDSVKIIVLKESSYFELKIIDIHAGVIFNLKENIFPINYIGDIRWQLEKDTLRVNFVIINSEGEIDSMIFLIKEFKKNVSINAGTYEDSLWLDVTTLPNGNYMAMFNMYKESRKIDEVQIRINIVRPFYLDEASWHLKVEQLAYIATPSEIKKLKVCKKTERDSLWNELWRQHDPTPNTEYNEKEIEYFARIKYCEEHFSHGDKGWRSDRAKIYVKYGTPDEIQRYPYYNPPKDPYRPLAPLYDAYEIWVYYKNNRRYIFGDRHGLGQYVLLNPGGSNL